MTVTAIGPAHPRQPPVGIGGTRRAASVGVASTCWVVVGCARGSCTTKVTRHIVCVRSTSNAAVR